MIYRDAFLFWRLSILIAVAAPFGSLPSTSLAADEDGWSFSLGAAYRSVQGVQFDVGRRSSFKDIQKFELGNRGFDSAGPLNSFADRSYLDGYVFRDANTGSPSAAGSDLTWFWGYRNSSQVSGDTISFHLQSSELVETSRNRPRGEEDGESATPYFSLQRWWSVGKCLRIAPTLTYLFISFDTHQTDSTFSAAARSSLLTDTYSLGGIVAPTSPYSGTFVGPGPLISNLPSSRAISGMEDSGVFYRNRVEQSIDVDVHTLSLGPTLRWEARRLQIDFQPGLSINIADYSVSRDEKLLRSSDGKVSEIRRWSNRASHTEVLPGFFVQGGVGYKFSDRWSATAFFRYEWSCNLRGEVGPSSYSVNLNGSTTGTYLTWRF